MLLGSGLLVRLYQDEAGFVISSELVLVGTITVLSMVVGLSEVAFNVNQELEDVGAAFGSVNQGYFYNGTAGGNGTSQGSQGNDSWDGGDESGDVVGDIAPTPESF